MQAPAESSLLMSVATGVPEAARSREVAERDRGWVGRALGPTSWRETAAVSNDCRGRRGTATVEPTGGRR